MFRSATILGSTGRRAVPFRRPSGLQSERALFHTSCLKRFPSSASAVGIQAAATAAEGEPTKSTLFSKELSIHDRVALVSGGSGDIGLEMALALVEAGARAVYCIDRSIRPSEKWERVRQYAKGMEGKSGEGRLEYVAGDVTDQDRMWKVGEMIGDREGRMDIGVACAGIIKDAINCMDYPADAFRQVLDVNTTGALFAAQAAGRQMIRFGRGGSIILVASIGGSVAMQNICQTSYSTSKAAVIQMARSIACELAPQGIRVNSLSPGWTQTQFVNAWIDADPEYFKKVTPMNRVGETRELRGVTAWLASDASSYCTGTDIIIDGGLHAW